jgi:hypothetical protein
VPARRPAGDSALRVLLTLALALVALGAAVVLAFLGMINWSGCFIACSEPDHVAGAASFAGAAAAPAAAAWAVRRLWRLRAPAVRAWSWLLGGVVAAYVAFGLVATTAQVGTDALCAPPDVSPVYSAVGCPVPDAAWAAAWVAAGLPLAAAVRLALRARRG